MCTPTTETEEPFCPEEFRRLWERLDRMSRKGLEQGFTILLKPKGDIENGFIYFPSFYLKDLNLLLSRTLTY